MIINYFLLVFLSFILGAISIGLFLHFYLAKKSINSGKNAKLFGQINGVGLMALHNIGVDSVLVDARAPMFDDGKRIYEAIKIDFSMSKEKIVSLLPDKKRLIIIYCGGYECPAGAMLARKLLSMGYKNVIDYPGGINEWKNIKQNRK